MMAPAGMGRTSVTGGGDCRKLAVGGGWRAVGWSGLTMVMEGVRRCLFRYDAECGREGREPCWIEERRLTSGETETEEAGDRDGGV